MVRRGPVGSLRDPEGAEPEFARFPVGGITVHIETRLLSTLPPQGGEIRFALGESGTATIELRPTP